MVRELRLVVTAEAYNSPDGRVTILEVGRRVAGHIRVAFEVGGSAEATRRLEAGGAEVLAEPTRTPWNSLNARLAAPAGLQLTLFQELG